MTPTPKNIAQKPLNRTAKSALLVATIRANSATAAGFAVTDCPLAAQTKAAHQACRRMVQDGTLFKTRINRLFIRYFNSHKAAEDFSKANFGKESPERASMKAKLTPVKAKGFQNYVIVQRKPHSPAAPKASATIVWPAKMPECRMMPPPRNTTVTHAFIHGGMGAMR